MKTIGCFVWVSLLGLATLAIADDVQPAVATQWRAGVATVKITPDQPMYMAGYAARKEQAEGTEQDLFAKALVIEDDRGHRAVLLTMDLIGVSDALRSMVADRVRTQHGIDPQSLLMNASHTHCGPAYTRDDAHEYFEWLGAALVDVVGQALADLQPAVLSYSQARCGFAMNRRTPTDRGYRNHPHPAGLVDHSVPVLSVSDPDGQHNLSDARIPHFVMAKEDKL